MNSRDSGTTTAWSSRAHDAVSQAMAEILHDSTSLVDPNVEATAKSSRNWVAFCQSDLILGLQEGSQASGSGEGCVPSGGSTRVLLIEHQAA